MSTFDTDTDGWTHNAGDPATVIQWSATLGNPGGAAELLEGNEGAGDYFLAPAKFLGDDLSAYGKQFTFDIADAIAAPASGTADGVALIGDGLILTHGFAPLTPKTYESVAITLDEKSGWTILNGGVPTQQQFEGVLSNVTELAIAGDFSANRDIVVLDNVVLRTPEPSAIVLAFIGAIGMAAVYYRRSHGCGVNA